MEAKERLLNDTYSHFLKTCITADIALSEFDDILAQDIMGFGTTIDETLFSKAEFYRLIANQREQSKDLDISWRFDPLFRRVSPEKKSAIYADNLYITFIVNNEKVEMFFRFSTVLEYFENRWQVVHWHGSKPEYVQSETDTFGLQDWKQKTEKLEKLVAERTNELTQQKEALEQALTELHNTQAQLIQSEKMASLGELTAGIAHEIQNPLNFVNNFSDVSNELISEMIDEMQNGDPEEARTIANDIRLNLEKIKHHGERADAIVKGMLQHSRVTSGQKEPADINRIADEYLRLAYHGLRAKDKDFNAELRTWFDNTLPNVNVVPQDIGRVLLNLFTNAFYATKQRTKSGGPAYKPEIIVQTFQTENAVIITVKDNGSGIPEAITDKILQPFFTTKPTGEGTGLGLSISYDIIVKAHGGTLKVNSREQEGTEFIITLPLNKAL